VIEILNNNNGETMNKCNDCKTELKVKALHSGPVALLILRCEKCNVTYDMAARNVKYEGDDTFYGVSGNDYDFAKGCYKEVV